MKTPKEIIEYLKKQSWYDEFVTNTKDWYKGHQNRINYIIDGYEGEYTIIMAFNWSNYNLNFDWSSINDNFIEWYNS